MHAKLVKYGVMGLLILSLQACVSFGKVEPGALKVGSLEVNVSAGWNSFPSDYGSGKIYSREGIALDSLIIYGGVSDNSLLHPALARSQAKPIVFRSSMQLNEVLTAFEQLAQIDGSRFELTRSAPVSFAGKRAIRFEYLRTRKGDNVVLQGMGIAAIDAGKLYAINYTAPRLYFFAKDKAEVERIFASAVIK